jgi:hypothetical protein
MSRPKLTSKIVQDTLAECRFRPDDRPGENVAVDGVVHKFQLHRGRLEAKREFIEQLLEELPLEFRRTNGPGASFLTACNDRHGEQWTDLQSVMEELFVLGVGTGKVLLVAGRQHWHLLPGGVPWYRLDM